MWFERVAVRDEVEEVVGISIFFSILFFGFIFRWERRGSMVFCIEVVVCGCFRYRLREFWVRGFFYLK